MAVPETYLLTVPDIKDDPFGRCISSTDIIRKLKKINPLIIVWDQYSPGVWFPGKNLGLTCLWYETIGESKKKITGIRHGPVPEWTQLDDKGEIITKGWRDIFRRVVKFGAVRAVDIEQAFGVSLVTEKENATCDRCRRAGKVVKATSASGYCDMHDRVRLQVEHARQVKQEKKYQRRIA